MIQIAARKSQEEKAGDWENAEKAVAEIIKPIAAEGDGERLLFFLLILMVIINHFYDIYASKTQLKACAYTGSGFVQIFIIKRLLISPASSSSCAIWAQSRVVRKMTLYLFK